MAPDNLISHPALDAAYRAFNARDIDAALALMIPKVEWPNGMEGGYVYGHQAVRDYWTRQWQMINPRVEPLRYEALADGRVATSMRQVVRNLAGAVLVDQPVRHVYQFADGLISRMEIEAA